MKLSNFRIIDLTKFGLLLLLTVAIAACAGVPALNNSTSSWKEEVLLHDGNKIIATRTLERGGMREYKKHWGIRAQSLSFINPNTKQSIVWHDGYSQDISGTNFLPMMLEIKDDVPYLVVNPMGLLSYNKWGRPNPPYVIFRYQDNNWQRISLDELPMEFNEFNLIISTPDENAKRLAVNGVVSAQKIREYLDGRRNDTTPKEYKSLVREPIKVGSMTLVRTGNGWKSLDWFTKKPSLEACMNFCDSEKVTSENCPCNSIFKAE